MKILTLISSLILCSSAYGEDIALTIESYDEARKTASLLVMDFSQIPIGTKIRVNSKTGQCLVQINEQVGDRLIGTTEGCESGVINPGMKLAYTEPNSWETPETETVSSNDSTTPSWANETRTSWDDNDNILNNVLNRTSVFVGHSFSSQLEGKVYADGSVRNLDGDTAFSFGVKGRVYDFTPLISLAVELGYETPRTLDQVTVVPTPGGGSQTTGTSGFSPRLSLWSLAVLGEMRVLDRLNAFGGLNYAMPSMGNSPFSMSGGIGFQGGANFEVYENVAVEGLIKINNMTLRNDIGEKTDVALAGLELRGRYSF